MFFLGFYRVCRVWGVGVWGLKGFRGKVLGVSCTGM